MSVFIVGCSAETADIIRRGLEIHRLPPKIRAFKTGLDAIDALCDSNRLWPDLIIVDTTATPDAERFVEFVKLSPFVRKIPMIALGAATEAAALRHTETLGLLGVLTHPFTPEQLAAVMNLPPTELR